MVKSLVGLAVAVAAYRARRNGVRVSFGIGTIGLHLGRTYFDVHRSFGQVGVFWCVRDPGGAISERGWLSQNGSWKIESVNGIAVGRLGYLRRCRRYEAA